MKKIYDMMEETADYIRNESNNFHPQIGLILGSGLGDLAEEIQDPTVIPYEKIPHMPLSTVEGHAGKLFLGMLEGKRVMAYKGRIHYYEGYSMTDITFPVRIMQAMGVKIMIVTNACGGVRDDMKAGDLVLIRDHINFMGSNPLIGPNDNRLGPRFPDMSNVYDRDLRKMAKEAAEESGVDLKEGVYLAVTGPNYETFAETRYMKSIGADTIGMSTIPEAIVAAHAGMKTIGMSCVTDVIHEVGTEVSHEEVLEVAARVKPNFLKLMKKIISKLQL